MSRTLREDPGDPRTWRGSPNKIHCKCRDVAPDIRAISLHNKVAHGFTGGGRRTFTMIGEFDKWEEQFEDPGEAARLLSLHDKETTQ